MAVDRDGRRGNQDEITSFLFLDVKVLLATIFQSEFALHCAFFCKRIEGEGDQEQYENKGSLAGGGGSCIASCIV